MGWGRDEFGAWIPPISFRIRESADNFDDDLKLASFSGRTFEVTREDGLKDIIYSETGQRPYGSKNQMVNGEYSNIIQVKK